MLSRGVESQQQIRQMANRYGTGLYLRIKKIIFALKRIPRLPSASPKAKAGREPLLSANFLCPQEELNFHFSLRRAALYPLSYGDKF